MDKTTLPLKKQAFILALETAVPPAFLSQKKFSLQMSHFLGFNSQKTALMNRIASASQIDKRHTVIPDFLEQEFHGPFFGSKDNPSFPTTSQRNNFYKQEAPKLAKLVCQNVLKAWGGNLQDITHVISVSCTGLIAPGLEFLLIEQLNLSKNVERLGINFMGCFGAFKGLAIAKALALENPKHRILLVCTELCSLHFQASDHTETCISNAIFADGAAAAVVGVETRKGETPLLEIYQQASTALEKTQDLMTWEVGDFGFYMKLSKTIPHHLEKAIYAFTKRLTDPHLFFDQCIFAIHPGGKAILEAVTKACFLKKEQLLASWKVLKHYGNMSSPTFLFVLKEVLQEKGVNEWVVGLGFGPGLSVEGLLLKKVDNYVAK